LFVSISLISVAAVWLFIHLVVWRKLRGLHTLLPAAYHSALAAPTDQTGAPRLIPLAIDLMRKSHCAVTYDALTPSEQRVALHAFAVEQCRPWVIKIALQRLRGPEKTVIQQLRFIKTSRPEHKPVHFGAIRRQQQLRSATKI
jgi:hypothetical protein